MTNVYPVKIMSESRLQFDKTLPFTHEIPANCFFQVGGLKTEKEISIQ